MNGTKFALEIFVEHQLSGPHSGGVSMYSHFSTTSGSFGRSAKLRTYFASRTPDWSLDVRMSHLFRKRTRSTLARSLLEQTSFQRSTLSSCSGRQLT